jgi:hypothetical protein
MSHSTSPVLTDTIATAILARRALGASYARLSREFRIHVGTIEAFLTGRRVYLQKFDAQIAQANMACKFAQAEGCPALGREPSAVEAIIRRADDDEEPLPQPPRNFAEVRERLRALRARESQNETS